MACAELFMMALLAAVKKHNMTQEPIVMWLGNSSSPPRLIPWSSVNKSPGGGHGKQPKPRLGVSPEDLAKPLRNSSEQTLTPLAALRSYSRQPHSKKSGGRRKKKKAGGVHGPRTKKNGKKKFRKGARKPRGGRGRSKRKGRKKADGAKKPPRGKKQTTSSSQTKKKSTRRRDSSASPEASIPTRTTRGRQQRHPHSPGGGQRSQSGKPATKPGDGERDKTGASFKKTSLTWTSTSLKLVGTRAIGSLKPESSTSGASIRPGKAATLKLKDGKEHSTLSTGGTGQPSDRRHHGTTKSKQLLGDHGSTKSAEQGRPPAMPHRGMLPKTQSSSPDKTAVTNGADKHGRKQGIEQAAGHSSRGTTKKPLAVTPSSKAGSSKPTVAASQAPAQMRGGKNSNGNTSKPAESSGTSSAVGSTQSSKTSATNTDLSSSPARKTGSGLTKRPRDRKFGAPAAAAAVSKTRPPESRESRQGTRRHSLQTTSKGNSKQGVTTQDAPPHKKKTQELHGRRHQRHNHPGSTREPTRRPDVTSLLTALRRLEQATKASERATANKAAQTKRPEAKDAQKVSISPQTARVANSASLSSLLPTIRVKAPEASTSKSKR